MTTNTPFTNQIKTVMKNLALTLIAGLLIGICTSYEPVEATAEVEKYQGLYMFIESEPVLEYELLGTVKLGVTWIGTIDEIKERMTKKAKKKFPEGDGLIFYLAGSGLGDDFADVIKFKKTDN
jgi:hypothetical protein